MQDAESQGVAVVELFTSQGCSSCPPADRLLTTLDDLASERGLPIYPLSMHVDYWNYLGWSDPYSSEEFSKRQHRYARAARSTRVYTPQMVVNGQAEFTGSDGRSAQRAISEALARAAQATVELSADATHDGLRVDYRVTGADAGSDLVVCLVSDTEPNDVARGENAGRSLSHRNVVRRLRSTPLDAGPQGSVDLLALGGIRDDQGLEIVAFVQDRRSRAITGAARLAAPR